MRKLSALTVLAMLSIAPTLYADTAPVEDLGQPVELERPRYSVNNEQNRDSRYEQSTYEQDSYAEQADAPSAFEQRLNKVEQQIANVNSQNAPGRIEQLQDELQQLRGQLEKQTHDIAVLARQQKQFYQDLSQRITQNLQTAKSASQAMPALATGQSESVSPNESQAYRVAFESLKSKQYDQAIDAFQKYLVRYPAGHYVVNSNYWLGEIYYLQGKSMDAKKAFTSVVKNYPNSQKMPDAMLKLAIIEIEAGNKAQGQQLLEQVQQRYPGTTAARLAALRYQELKLSS